MYMIFLRIDFLFKEPRYRGFHWLSFYSRISAIQRIPYRRTWGGRLCIFSTWSYVPVLLEWCMYDEPASSPNMALQCLPFSSWVRKYEALEDLRRCVHRVYLGFPESLIFFQASSKTSPPPAALIRNGASSSKRGHGEDGLDLVWEMKLTNPKDEHSNDDVWEEQTFPIYRGRISWVRRTLANCSQYTAIQNHISVERLLRREKNGGRGKPLVRERTCGLQSPRRN